MPMPTIETPIEEWLPDKHRAIASAYHYITSKQTKTLKQYSEGKDYKHPYKLQPTLHKLTPTPAERKKFYKLLSQWQAETINCSSMDDIVNNLNYHCIIGMGMAALPMILEELASSPDYWFRALNAITEKYPIAPEHEGDLDKMANDWLLFARKNGWIEYESHAI